MVKMTFSPKRTKSVCAYSYITQKKHHNDAHFQNHTPPPTVFSTFSDGVNETQILVGLVFFFIRIVKWLICLFNSGGLVASTSVKYSQVAGDEKAEEAAAGL